MQQELLARQVEMLARRKKGIMGGKQIPDQIPSLQNQKQP